jgi:hypothetical protein
MNTAEANEVIANNTIILMRGDFNSALHPRMFDEICEQLGHDPRRTDELTLFIRKSRAE